MADESKIGTPWSDDELDEIVSDYFVMLETELSGKSYVKSHRSAALMERIGRTHRSVEFKHQNISAVLEELGLPWIWGYKPKRNYQYALIAAVDRYLSKYGEARFEQPPSHRVGFAEDQDVFVIPPPATGTKSDTPPELRRLIRKFDPAEREARNRQLGKAGEEFVVGIERARLERCGEKNLAKKVRWVAQEDGDGAGYDILSFWPDGKERLIEVKTTNGSARTPFFLTKNEKTVAEESALSWQLYRVHLFSHKPSIFVVEPPLENSLALRPETWRASLR